MNAHLDPLCAEIARTNKPSHIRQWIRAFERDGAPENEIAMLRTAHLCAIGGR